MGVSPAMPVLNASKPLSYELVDYLAGLTGRNFRDRSVQGDGWSAVVWDLINYSAVNTFNRIKQSNLKNRPRNVTSLMQAGAGFVTSGSASREGVMAGLFGSHFEAWLGGNKDIPPQSNFDIPEGEGGNGPSVILIETFIGSRVEE